MGPNVRNTALNQEFPAFQSDPQNDHVSNAGPQVYILINYREKYQGSKQTFKICLVICIDKVLRTYFNFNSQMYAVSHKRYIESLKAIYLIFIIFFNL